MGSSFVPLNRQCLVLGSRDFMSRCLDAEGMAGEAMMVVRSVVLYRGLTAEVGDKRVTTSHWRFSANAAKRRCLHVEKSY